MTQAKDVAQDAAGGGLLDKIKEKAVSGNSPQRQLEKVRTLLPHCLTPAFPRHVGQCHWFKS